MNDRYLYRAKRTDNGEWVEGNLIYAKKDYYICENPYECMNQYSSLNGQSYGFGGFKLVDQYTICQCTGLKDKNGKLIFENDVVEMYDRNIDFKWRAVLIFGNPREYTWGWHLEPIGECNANEDILCWIDMEESGASCEVIGNIFDNQELLEVGK